MHDSTSLRGSCMAQAAPREALRSMTSLKPGTGRSSPSRTEVIIDQSQQVHDDITSSYIMRGPWSARDRSTAPRSQRSTPAKCRTSMVYHGGWIPSYMWSYLDFNVPSESLVTGDVQGHSLYMKPVSSDCVSDSGSSSDAVPPFRKNLRTSNQTVRKRRWLR